jgi:glutamine synthetase
MIFDWAMKNGAKYYTFFGYPQTEGVLEKQETFLDISFFYEHTLKCRGKSAFGSLQLGKGEGDGSSFPSGGLR